MPVGEASLELGIDFDALRKSLEKAGFEFKKQTKKIQKKTSDAGKKTGKEFGEGFQDGIKSLKGSIAGVIAALGINKLRQAVMEFVDSMSEIGKQAKRMGITAEEVQKLNFIVRKGGADAAALEDAYKDLSNKLLDLANGSDEVAKQFALVGLTFEDFQNKRPEETLEMVLQALGDIPDAQRRLALAQKILGESGRKLLPVIENYKELKQEIEEIGVATNEDVKAAEDFTDSMETLTTAVKKLVVDTGFIKFLADAAEGLTALFTHVEKKKILLESLAETLMEIGTMGLVRVDLTDTTRPGPTAADKAKEAEKIEKNKLEKEKQALMRMRRLTAEINAAIEREEKKRAKTKEEAAINLERLNKKALDLFQKGLDAQVKGEELEEKRLKMLKERAFLESVIADDTKAIEAMEAQVMMGEKQLDAARELDMVRRGGIEGKRDLVQQASLTKQRLEREKKITAFINERKESLREMQTGLRQAERAVGKTDTEKIQEEQKKNQEKQITLQVESNRLLDQINKKETSVFNSG